jgi:hypothetical protein
MNVVKLVSIESTAKGNGPLHRNTVPILVMLVGIIALVQESDPNPGATGSGVFADQFLQVPGTIGATGTST